MDIEGSPAVVVWIIEIGEVRQFAEARVAVHELVLENLAETAEAVEPVGLLRQGRVGDMRVELGKKVIAVVSYHLLSSERSRAVGFQ